MAKGSGRHNVCRNPFYFVWIPGDRWLLNRRHFHGNSSEIDKTPKQEDGNEEESNEEGDRPQEELQRKRHRTLPLHPDQGEINFCLYGHQGRRWNPTPAADARCR